MEQLGKENPDLKVIQYDGVGHEVKPPMLTDFKKWALQFIPTSRGIDAKLSSVKI